MASIRWVFLCLGAAAGFLYPYTAVIFKERGLDPAAIGFVLAVAAAGSILAGPAWGHVADIVLGRRRALAVALAASAAALLVFALPAPVVIGAIAYVLFGLSTTGHGPLLDALTVNALRREERGDYGRIRLFSSLAFAVTAIASGFAFDRTGYWPGPVLAGALFGVACLMARTIPDVRKADGDRVAGGRRGEALRAAIAHQPRLPVVYLTFAIGAAGSMAVLTFMPIRLVDVGGTPSDVALASGLDAVAEVLGLLGAGWVARRLGLRGLYLCAMAVMAACFVALAAAGSPEAIIVIRTVMGVGFAGSMVAGVLTIGAMLPAGLQGTGQALAGAFGGVAAITANLGGGLLYTTAGPATLFVAAAAAAVLAGGLGLAILPGRGRGAGRGAGG